MKPRAPGHASPVGPAPHRYSKSLTSHGDLAARPSGRADLRSAPARHRPGGYHPARYPPASSARPTAPEQPTPIRPCSKDQARTADRNRPRARLSRRPALLDRRRVVRRNEPLVKREALRPVALRERQHDLQPAFAATLPVSLATGTKPVMAAAGAARRSCRMTPSAVRAADSVSVIGTDRYPFARPVHRACQRGDLSLPGRGADVGPPSRRRTSSAPHTTHSRGVRPHTGAEGRTSPWATGARHNKTGHGRMLTRR